MVVTDRPPRTVPVRTFTVAVWLLARGCKPTGAEYVPGVLMPVFRFLEDDVEREMMAYHDAKAQLEALAAAVRPSDDAARCSR